MRVRTLSDEEVISVIRAFPDHAYFGYEGLPDCGGQIREWKNLPLHLSSSASCIFSCRTACLQTRHTTLAFHTRGGLCPSTQNFPAIACGDLRLVRCFVGTKRNFISRSSKNGSGSDSLNLPRLETASS